MPAHGTQCIYAALYLRLVEIGSDILSNYSISSYELQYNSYTQYLYKTTAAGNPAAVPAAFLLIDFDIHADSRTSCIRSLVLKLNIHCNPVGCVTSIGNCIFKF